VRWSSYGSDSLQLRLQLEGCDLVVFPFLFLRWNIPDLWVFSFVTLRDIGGIAWDNEHFSSSLVKFWCLFFRFESEKRTDRLSGYSNDRHPATA
jgi:hypothetical protein